MLIFFILNRFCYKLDNENDNQLSQTSKKEKRFHSQQKSSNSSPLPKKYKCNIYFIDC